jgi:glycosyltransferase involved in cell wall biosynthesis
VAAQTRRPKRPLILAVGRFFDPAAGHGKRQLELVDAFRELRVEGWELALAGGCDRAGEAYLDQVRRAAVGAAVELHPNASGARLRALYADASLYWHAAGLSEDPERHPERFEHFGIAVVEAMSAGAVPLVFAGGGLPELFEDGQAGVHWRSPHDLVARTRQLLADPARRAAMADLAVLRAERYLQPAFAERLRALVDQLTA